MADNPFVGAVQVPNYSSGAFQGHGNAASYAAPLLDFSALSTLGQPQQQPDSQQQAQNFGQALAAFVKPKSAQTNSSSSDTADMRAISANESGGNYLAVGPTTSSGDRAYGKYQIMGNNIPQWSAEALGQPMNILDFLHNPKAQDAVFQHKFGQYKQKYGSGGAARAWFAGEGGMNNPQARDMLGTSVAEYQRRFLKNLNQ